MGRRNRIGKGRVLGTPRHSSRSSSRFACAIRVVLRSTTPARVGPGPGSQGVGPVPEFDKAAIAREYD